MQVVSLTTYLLLPGKTSHIANVLYNIHLDSINKLPLLYSFLVLDLSLNY